MQRIKTFEHLIDADSMHSSLPSSLSISIRSAIQEREQEREEQGEKERREREQDIHSHAQTHQHTSSLSMKHKHRVGHGGGERGGDGADEEKAEELGPVDDELLLSLLEENATGTKDHTGMRVCIYEEREGIEGRKEGKYVCM